MRGRGEQRGMETIEFEGWPGCVRLTNGAAEIVIARAFGPRILRYGLVGGPNAFHILPETRGQIGTETWLPYGGHRLWHAPEVLPRSYAPDNVPVDIVQNDRALHVTGHTEASTGIQKQMTVTLAPGGSAARVAHRLTNHGVWPITLAPWGLSIVALGGFVVIPQEPFVSHDDVLDAARPIVVWKFTDMADPRWRWGTKYLTLRQTDAPTKKPQKVGVWNTQGWAAHVAPAHTFLIEIEPARGGPASLPDMGSNFETYTDGPFQELETLGPLVTLAPGASVEHVEHWFLAPTTAEDNDAALDAHLLPLLKTARAAFSRSFEH